MKATIINRRRHRFGIVEERTLEDPRLGPVARTAAAWIQVKPLGWTISVEHLQYRLGIGVSAWRTASRELRDAGYLAISRTRGALGQWVWKLDFDVPEEVPEPGKRKPNATRKESIDGEPTDGDEKPSRVRTLETSTMPAISKNSIDGRSVDALPIDEQTADKTLPKESPTETLLTNTTTRTGGIEVVVIESKAAVYRDLLDLAFADLSVEQRQILADTLEHRLRRPIDPPGSIARWITTVKRSLLGQGENPFDRSGALEIAANRARAKANAEAVARSMVPPQPIAPASEGRSSNPKAISSLRAVLKAAAARDSITHHQETNLVDIHQEEPHDTTRDPQPTWKKQ
ncbi:hypothetical protein [Trinickia acidisoli]|uniref:hypothetical protein n=1 Tax=Trinickia acidisoli TaxID=2767482 RepID=UPI001A8D4134|nr:hypothetical protein [Trinickia acidisoli]